MLSILVFRGMTDFKDLSAEEQTQQSNPITKPRADPGWQLSDGPNLSFRPTNWLWLSNKVGK